MDLRKLKIAVDKPKLYEKADSVMWTDKYISKQLLKAHLDPEIDAASRIQQSIDNTVNFISKHCNKAHLNILDLGCGPGIYAEKFAELGHQVTGVDFSENSITYAKKQAKEKKLNIEYICKDYLELDYENRFDLILIIYTDFGVLIPEERDKLLWNIFRALKKGGSFIFDVLNERNKSQKFQEKQTWNLEVNGFWKNRPYLELTAGFNYQTKNVFLKQHTIIDESDIIKTYRFWIHYFNIDNLSKILKAKGFRKSEHFENILPSTNLWNGENVTFYKTAKI